MSMKHMVRAFEVSVGNPLRKLVLIKLSDNANDKGECWPSYQHIADQCEISKRSVMTHIAALCDAGLIKKTSRKGPKGNASNIYILTLDGGAGDSLGVVQEIHHPGAGDSLGGAGDSLAPSAGAAPGISHSLEPPKEPPSESIAHARKSPCAGKQRNQRAPDYPPEFEAVWRDYPKRAGGNSKKSAFKAWKARIKSGADPQAMANGVARYARFCAVTGKLGTEYVKQASTFLGPDEHYLSDWSSPDDQPQSFTETDYSKGVTADGRLS